MCKWKKGQGRGESKNIYLSFLRATCKTVESRNLFTRGYLPFRLKSKCRWVLSTMFCFFKQWLSFCAKSWTKWTSLTFKPSICVWKAAKWEEESYKRQARPTSDNYEQGHWQSATKMSQNVHNSTIKCYPISLTENISFNPCKGKIVAAAAASVLFWAGFPAAREYLSSLIIPVAKD